MPDFSLPDLFAQNINNPFADTANDDSLTDESEQTIKGFDTETDQVSEDKNRLSDSVFDDNSDSLRKHCRMRTIPVNLRIQAMDLLRKHPPMIYIQMS